MASLPSLTELGLLGHHALAYTPWWTTLDSDVDTAEDVFQRERLERKYTEGKRDYRPRKRRAVSPDDQDKPTLSLAVPNDDDVPELEDSLSASAELQESPESSPEPSPESSPEPSPEPSPQTSPETHSADLALPIRRLLPPPYLLPLPLPVQKEALTFGDRRDRREYGAKRERQPSPDKSDARNDKRKRDAPPKLALANLLSPTPHVYCLYKFDRVDQLGGRRRGMRVSN